MLFGEDYEDIPNAVGGGSQGLGLAQPAAPAAPAQDYSWTDILKATARGGIIGGASRRDPLALFKVMELEEQQKHRNKQLEMQKEQIRTQKISHFFSFLEKFDVDEDTASKAIDAMIDANPDLQEVFGDLKGKVRVTGKDKQTIKTVSTFKDGELIDPITGRAAPAGTYEVEAKNKGGKLELVSFKPAEDKGPFGKVDTEKFTAESIADFQKSGGKDYSLLKPRDSADTEDTKTMRTNAQMLFGKKITNISDLPANEQQDVQLYTGIREPAIKTAIDALRIKPENKGKSITELYGQAVLAADSRVKGNRVDVAVRIAGEGSEAREKGKERGLQAVLQDRLARIEKEAEAANEGRPIDATTRESVSQLMNIRNQAAVIQENYDPEFLGPIRGTAAAYAARRRVGTYVGSPLGQKETTMRQSLNDTQATITYALSGKQINEGEASRLRGMLPQATDEPQVFQAGMRRFDNEMASIIENKIRLAKTTRGNLPAGAPIPNAKPGSGVAPTPAQSGWSIRPR